MSLRDSGLSHVCKHQCPYCTYYTEKAKHLKSHIAYFHKEKPTIEDQACSYKGCLQPQEIISPSNQDAYPFKCDQCPYVDVNEDLLKFHKNMLHKIKKDHKNILIIQLCNACEFTTTDSISMDKHICNEHVTNHIASTHTVTKQVLNEDKQKNVVMQDSYTEDLPIKEKQSFDNFQPPSLQYDCELCEFQSEEQNILQDHLIKIHYKDTYETERIDMLLNVESVMEIEKNDTIKQNNGNSLNILENTNIKQTTITRVENEKGNKDFRRNIDFMNSHNTNAIDKKETNVKILDIETPNCDFKLTQHFIISNEAPTIALQPNVSKETSMQNGKLILPRLAAIKKPEKIKTGNGKLDMSAGQETLSRYDRITAGQDNKKLDTQIMSMLERQVKVQQKGWNCKKCGYIDKMGMKLMDHVEIAHLEAGHHPCTQCGKDFNFRGSLRLHKQSTRYCTPFLLCSCGSKFKNQEPLKRHQAVCPVFRI